MIEKQQIIISYFRQGVSQREISKKMGLNRKTVRRYIHQYKQEKLGIGDINEIGVVQAPKYDSTNRTKSRLTPSVQDFIDKQLKLNAEKRVNGNFKQCLKAVDIHEALEESGFQISYSSVCNYIRAQKRKGQEVFIRQEYKPGQCAQFDWGFCKLVIGGKQKNVSMAVFSLPFSSHRWAMLFYRQDMSSFLFSHVEYFKHIAKVPLELVYDNMKTAVAKFTVRQSDKVPTDDLLKISSYYQFNYRFCNAAKGNEKGHVERSIEYIRRKAFCRTDRFESLQDAQHQLNKVLNKLNNKTVKGKHENIDQHLKKELAFMIQAPAIPYNPATTQYGKIDKYHTVCIDTNHYSVPEQIFTTTVEYKLYPHHIVIFDADHHPIAEHKRIHAKHKWCIDINHYWKTFNTKPGALKHAKALGQAPDLVRSLYNDHYYQNPKKFITLCLLCKAKKWSFELLYKATILTLQQSPHCPITVDKVRWNIQSIVNQGSPDLSNQNMAKKKACSMSDLIDQHCEKQLRDIQSIL